jgi:NADPH:quinone reductase-like Zn-dependent oxidoreductase
MQLRLSGVSIGSRADQEDMIRAIEVNAIQPVIDQTFPLDQLAAAFEYNRAQRRLGKVGIEITA